MSGLNSKDYNYNIIKAQFYFTKNYEITKENASKLNDPIVSVKDSQELVDNLTYRKINDWDEKGFISGSRESKKGWRKFSIVDLVIFYIITDLRKFGYSTERINFILKDILNSSIDFDDPIVKKATINTEEKEAKEKGTKHDGNKHPKPKGKVPFQLLEYFIFNCTQAGNKTLLLIDEKDNALLFNEEAAFAWASDFFSDSPVIILPFFSYVQKLWGKLFEKIIVNERSTLKGVVQAHFVTVKEKEIIDIIRNKKYKEIKIKKPNEDEYRITAKSITEGKITDEDVINMINSKEYQNVQVITESGNKVSIIQEEKIKI